MVKTKLLLIYIIPQKDLKNVQVCEQPLILYDSRFHLPEQQTEGTLCEQLRSTELNTQKTDSVTEVSTSVFGSYQLLLTTGHTKIY